MTHITTAHILADKLLQKTCGQECVDWAISMLDEGHDGECLSRLWGMVPPFNHFEIAALRDHALTELGMKDFARTDILSRYATELLQSGLSGEVPLVAALTAVKELYIAADDQANLFDFYLLFFAYDDLIESEFTYHWPEATRDNILEIIRERSEAFVRRQERDG